MRRLTLGLAQRLSYTGLVIRTTLSACGIVLLFLLQVQVTNLAFRDGIQPLHSAIMIASGGMQSAALYVLYRSLRGSLPTLAATIVLTCAALATAALSLWSKNTSIDASAYVGYARLPSVASAYMPAPKTPAQTGFEPIAHSWGRRLPPLVYGPLWLLIDRTELAHARSYGEALLVLRITAQAILAGLVLALRGLAANWKTLP